VISREEMAASYEAALARHLARSDEETLSAAYEIGREALGADIGVLDVVAVHRGIVARIVRESAPNAIERAEAAADFLREALSPLEMAFRGYVQANVQLVHEREAVLAANEELEAFSYSVSHDLRAPLRAIDGFASMLEEDAADALPGVARSHLARIRANVDRMNRLIEDLLGLSRVGRAELVRRPVDLADLVVRANGRLRAPEPDRDVELTLVQPLVVSADPGLLAIAVDNLVGNAWKFTSKRERAHIEVGRDASGAFYVRDDGAGFDRAKAKKLFTAFQRFHASSEFPGTGIGLATVQRIVHRHGGRVWAESEPDRGATFHFTLGGGAG
jgi:signal transduction histidine kinase